MEELIEKTVLLKLKQLPIVQQQEVLNFVEFLEIKTSKKAAKILELEAAAESLLANYENDEELTAFTALDGEDFHV
jgi:hypothetical protein